MKKKNENYQMEYNIITLGDSGVGKTSIFKRYTLNSFDDNSMSTLGMAFMTKKINFKNGDNIKLKLVDTAGQEKYISLVKSYYKNADAVLFVFSLHERESFDHIVDWMDKFKENNNKENIPKFLVGNKNDLEIVVEEDLLNDFIKKNDIDHYISTSAKNNQNIKELFGQMVQILYKTNRKSGDQKITQLNQDIKPQKHSCFCKKPDV